MSTEAKNITDFLLLKAVPFFNTNNFAGLQVLPAIKLSFNPFSIGKIEKLNFSDSNNSTDFKHQ